MNRIDPSRGDPFLREQQLLLSLVLSMREERAVVVERYLHIALSDLLHEQEHEASVRSLLGFVPRLHTVFGYYRALCEALHEGMRSGLVTRHDPYQDTLRINVDAASVRYLDARWNEQLPAVQTLQQAYRLLYQRKSEA